MKNKYTVTYKVAPGGAKYVYQEDKSKYKKGDVHSSAAGHMWYVLSDGSETKSYGFESVNGEMHDEGRVTNHDEVAYQKTISEITVALTKKQYEKLLAFSREPSSGGFDPTRYRVLNNSCVDFVYSSLKVIGFNLHGFEGNLIPANNIKPLHNMLKFNGGKIVRDNLTRHGDWYEEKDLAACLWLTPEQRRSSPRGSSLIGINIDSSPQPQQSVTGEDKAQRDAANGYIHNSATHSISASGDMLSNTDFTSTQMASLASGGIRPGEIQLDPNIRPNVWLKDYDLTPNGYRPNQNLLNAVTLNGLSAMTTYNTYVDPLLLDLSGKGVCMTDIRNGVLFDMDNSGTLKRTGWADGETGILVVDNGSGQINNVSQMFSEFYAGKAGTEGRAGEKKYQNGFAALASEDANTDGIINEQDPIWNKLRVWVDSSHDAQVNEGEYKRLSELGISQISAHSTNISEVRDGNRVTASGSFTVNGNRQEILAVDFLGDPVSNTLSKQGSGIKVVSRTGDVATSAYASQSENGETLDATELGVNNLYGGTGDDKLIASREGSWLVGGAGSNTYIGGTGNDVFVISASDNESNIHGNGGHDTAIIVGSEGVELNMAKAGLTIAEGGSGNDIIRSGGANGIFIKGGSGDSTLIGGGGNDVLVGGSGQNTIIGGSGKSVIYAGTSGDTIYASEGGSIIYAGGGDDRIFGGYGDDVIEVGHGNATIDGDGGINLVTLHGNHGEYNILRTSNGYQVSDKVAGRDGTVTLKNIQKLNFSDISAVDLELPNAMPVSDTLNRDKQGRSFSRTQPHLISAESLLANDQRLNSKGNLRIADVGDATGGTVKLTAQGDILFTPDASYTGLLSFKYGIADDADNLSASVVDLNTGEQAPMRAVVSLMTPEMPDDPFVAQEWYLSDTNILSVWEDYTGKGVRIGQFEPGGQFATDPEIFDISHPDLAANVDMPWLKSQQDNHTLPALVSNHATMVAGIMVAAKNGIGGIGVAYDATLGGHYLTNSGEDLAGLGNMVSYDIANNSWGFTNDFALSNLQEGAINTAASLMMNAQYAAANGRGGLGTVVVTAGGNNRAAGGSAQGSLTNNNRFSIEVGSINAQSDLSTLQIGSKPFSNPGASLLVSAPGSNIVSTSRMLETERGSVFGNDYSSMQGTSFATPIVSGIVALMLEANPNLGYRDVQKILALSARKINDTTTQWQDNQSSSWNGGGMHASHDYGFGEVDARAAVRLAESWMEKNTAANEQVVSGSSGQIIKMLSAGDTLTSSITINDGLAIEHVEIDLDAHVGQLGDVTLKLISPDGTVSQLLNRQGKIPDGMPGANDADRGSNRAGTFKYTFMTTHDFGERSKGEWTLQISDAKSGLPVTLNAWSLRLYGSKISADDTYFYTDEYNSFSGNTKRTILDDAVNGTPGGRNTLQAAAVTKDLVVNLQTGVSSIGGIALAIKNPANIHNIVSGEGNDTLIAASANSLLDGGRGANILTGGHGKDYFVIHRRKAGSDVINNFESDHGEIINLVGFKGKKFADLKLSQQGSDVSVELEQGQSITLTNQKVASLQARHFYFQDVFHAPDEYVHTGTKNERPKEGLGTVILQGGSKGVKLTSNTQGQMTFTLNGIIYSHDSAASDIFVVAPQPGVKNYQNALRGFRHGVDKLDLRELGITDFSQLSITKNKRGTINGLSQIHGVDISFEVKGKETTKVNLVYLDSLETSQIDAGDFIFAQFATDLLLKEDPVGVDNPFVVDSLPPAVQDKLTIHDPVKLDPPEFPTFDFEPIKILPLKPEPLQPIDWTVFDFKPFEFKPIDIPKIEIKKVVFEPLEFPVLIPYEGESKQFSPVKLEPVNTLPVISEDKTSFELEDISNVKPDNASINGITLKKISEEVTFGNESKVINIESICNKVIAGNGDNRINVNGNWSEITLGNGNNFVAGKLDKITVGHGNNTINDSGSFTKMKLGDGNNKVLLSGSMPTVEVGRGINDLKFTGGMGHLVFAENIDPSRLWFRHTEQDLQISVRGSEQRVVLHDWYASTASRPWDITTGGNSRLMYHNVENLVQAMAAFSPSTPATTLLSENELQRLQPVIAANWH